MFPLRSFINLRGNLYLSFYLNDIQVQLLNLKLLPKSEGILYVMTEKMVFEMNWHSEMSYGRVGIYLYLCFLLAFPWSSRRLLDQNLSISMALDALSNRL